MSLFEKLSIAFTRRAEAAKEYSRIYDQYMHHIDWVNDTTLDISWLDDRCTFDPTENEYSDAEFKKLRDSVQEAREHLSKVRADNSYIDIVRNHFFPKPQNG